jgi:hypothetical protein
MGETRWMTYAELGRARGISTASATRLAFRRRWPRQAGNDGTARVAVPVGEDRPARDDRPDDRATDHPDITHVVTAFEASISALTGRAEAAESRADRAEARTDRAETARDAAITRADEAVTRADIADHARQLAETAAAELRQADAARRARGRLARAWRAWRGRD